MAVKFYEVAPELRESPIEDYDYKPGFWLENVSVTGNRLCAHHESELYRKACDIHSAIINYDLTEKEIKENYEIIDDVALKAAYCSAYNDEITCLLMQALSGNEYKRCEINGCVQGDWNYVYFPVSMGDDFIKWFETAYFNNGSEWIVEDNDDRISLYSCEWSNEKVKTDLANQYGVAVDQCEFYKFDGYVREPKYKVI